MSNYRIFRNMQKMIDVHIIANEEEKQKHWYAECLSSLKNEPINLRIFDRVGRPAASRAHAFAQGTAPYVSYVDPDDVIVPGIFEKIINVLEKDVTAVFTAEKIIDTLRNVEVISYEKPSTVPIHRLGQMHHIVVWRRDCFETVKEQMKQIVTGDSTKLISVEALLNGRTIGLEEIGYIWRIHKNSYHKNNLPDKNSTEIIRKQVGRLKWPG